MAVISDARVPSEGIRLEQPNTTLHVGANSVGTGTLYITESVVTWLSASAGDGKGITLSYPNIILHAVSRDLSRFPHECLYLHTDAEMPGFTQQRDESEDDDEIRDECPPVTELYFVPEDKASIDAMFHTMASCQALHPDPQDESSPDEDFDDGYEEYVMYGAHSRLANLQLSSNGTNGAQDDDVEMDPEIFEDAEGSLPEN